jgi:hypothetical protein
VFCAVSPCRVHYILGVRDEVQRWVAAGLLGVRACLVGEVGYLCDGSSGCELWRLMQHSTVVMCLGGGVSAFVAQDDTNRIYIEVVY